MSADIHTGPIADAPGVESETTALAHANGAGRAPVLREDANGQARVSPLALIQFAIESKLPAAELKELVALAEHVEERDARRAFFVALAQFQSECPPLKKNKTAKIATDKGTGFQYSYAERDVIEEHIKPYREKYGFSHVFDMSVDEKGILTAVCTVLHVQGFTRSARFTVPTTSNSGSSPQQKYGAADSYAQRRAIASAYGINITDKEVPDEEVDPTKITEAQAMELSSMLNESGANREKFFAYFDVESMLDLRAANYTPAKAMLEEKLAAKRRKAGA